jgi:hypothetical protein
MTRKLNGMLITALALLLAACGAPAQPTPTITPTPIPSATPEPTATIAPVVLHARTQDVILPGTLEVRANPAGTLTPAPEFTFTQLDFAQTGGVTGATLAISVTGDGVMNYNGVESTLSPEKLEALRAALEAINFFGLQGGFTGIGSSDAYSYTLTVESAAGSRTLRATEGYIPDQLQSLFDLIMDLNDDA